MVCSGELPRSDKMETISSRFHISLKAGLSIVVDASISQRLPISGNKRNPLTNKS